MTPATLPRHELAGLPVAVVDATAPSRVGISGRVVRETTNTLVVETADGERQLPKRGTTYEFALVGDSSTDPASERLANCSGNDRDGERAATGPDPLPADAERVVVAGRVLVGRPARRTENGVEATWH